MRLCAGFTRKSSSSCQVPHKNCVRRHSNLARGGAFNNAVGALDGKHAAIRCPRQLGSRYFNYKGFYSLVLLAVVDADYRFLWVDVESNGCCSDALIFNEWLLRETVSNGTIGFQIQNRCQVMTGTFFTI